MHANETDIYLMILGLIGTIGDGISMPIMMYTTCKLMNDIGDSHTEIDPHFIQSINKVYPWTIHTHRYTC